MSSVIIDRRPQTGKSAVNRQRVLRRLNKMLKDQVDQLVQQRKLGDMDSAAEVTIRKRDVSEPTFVLDASTGTTDRVVPGNTQYRVGDLIEKPDPEDGSGVGDGDGDGEGGEDSFRFMLSREEFLSLLFDDLELPALLKKELTDVVDTKFRRGGIVRNGNPGNLSVIRTFRASLGRRVAAGGSAQEDLDALERQLAAARECGNEPEIRTLELALDDVLNRKAHVPFIDPVDLRHRSLIEVSTPRTAAVMFCLMDVSGSMDEDRKDLAKRFFTMLYLFLTRKYEKVELVFIRHTDMAEEVDEHTFFYGTQNGGTRVLAALECMHKIIEARFPPSRYNIFGAQASDGDSFGTDPGQSQQFLVNTLLPVTRYFTYAETNESHTANTSLWQAYRGVKAENFNMAPICSRSDVYPALVRLFHKEATV